MKILKSPLSIAAYELLAAVEYSRKGFLMISQKKHRWKICYCIVSQGCLYLYEDWLSPKAFFKQLLKEFKSAWKSKEEHKKEENSFYLGYNDGNPPLHFCCDTEETQKEWVDELNRSILEVKTYVRPSCDSGYGSAGTVPPIDMDVNKETGIGTDDPYDEVDQRRFGNTNHGMKEEASVIQMKGQQHALDSTDTDDDYEDVSCSLVGLAAGHRKNSIASSFCSVSASSNSHCDMHLVHENDSEKKIVHSAKSERSKTDTERHNVKGLSAECRKNSIASSFCSVSAPSDPSCDILSLHSVHDDDSEIKAAHLDKSEESKTETERHNETTAKQNGAILFPKGLFDELNTVVHSADKGLSCGGHKEDMQPA